VNKNGSAPWRQEVAHFHLQPLVEREAFDAGLLEPPPIDLAGERESEDDSGFQEASEVLPVLPSSLQRQAESFRGVWKESFYGTTITMCYQRGMPEGKEDFKAEYTVWKGHHRRPQVEGKLSGRVVGTYNGGIVRAVGEWEEVPQSGRIMRGKFMITLHPGGASWSGYFQDGASRFLWEGTKRTGSEQEAGTEATCHGLQEPYVRPPEVNATAAIETEDLEGGGLTGLAPELPELAAEGEDKTEEEEEDLPVEEELEEEEPEQSAVRGPGDPKYSEGDEIQGRWMNGRVWYKGHIALVTGTGISAMYSINYDDGDKEKGVPEIRIRRVTTVNMLKSKSVELNDDNFDRIVGKGVPVFVNWYTTWCMHCKNFYASWEDVTQTLKKERKKKHVIIARINLEGSPSLAARFMVEMIPTFQWWSANATSPYDYDGTNDPGRMVSWVRERIQNPALDRTADIEYTTMPELTAATIEPHIGGRKHVLVMFYATWCRHSRAFHRQWENVHATAPRDLSPEVMIARVDSDLEPLLVARYQVRTFPTVLLFFANSSGDAVLSTPRQYESHMDAVSVVHWVQYHTGGGPGGTTAWWPRLDPSIIELLARTYDYTGGYLISSTEEKGIEDVNGISQSTGQCGGSLTASVYGEMLAEGIEQLLRELQLVPKDVFYDLGSGVGKLSLTVALRSKVGMVRGIEYSRTRYSIATNAVTKAYNGEVPFHNATRGKHSKMKGVTHCRHGYCVCVRTMPAMPVANQTAEQSASCKGGLGEYKLYGKSMVKRGAELSTADTREAGLGPRVWFENGDVGKYRPNGFDHATHVYSCSTLFSEHLIGKIVDNLRRSRHVKTFSTLKEVPANVLWKHLYMFYLWKTIKVPTTWHIDTEVYIYRFRGR